MKVTALVEDALIEDVRTFSGGRNITESMVIALSDWLRIQKIKKLNRLVEEEPLYFSDTFSAKTVRRLNRRKRI